jgi:methionine-rich copper-binding protein CopC
LDCDGNPPALQYNFLLFVCAGYSRSFLPFKAKGKAMFSGRRRFFAPVLFFAATLLLVVASAAAHAVLLESTPSLNASVPGPDVLIKLRFNVRIDASRSRLTLLRPDSSSTPLELAKDSPADTLSAHATGLAPGVYRLRWQALASDGHISRGEIPFIVSRN